MERSSSLVGYTILGSLTPHMMIGLGNGMTQPGKVLTSHMIGESGYVIFVYVLVVVSILDISCMTNL